MSKPFWFTIGEFNMCLGIILGLPVWVKAVIVLCLIMVMIYLLAEKLSYGVDF